jgi:hypothetical protein
VQREDLNSDAETEGLDSLVEHCNLRHTDVSKYIRKLLCGLTLEKLAVESSYYIAWIGDVERVQLEIATYIRYNNRVSCPHE